MTRCVVIGGGVGGLAAAIRLRAAGHEVAIVERHEVLGGKVAVRRRDGFVFDTGPSLVTLPELFDDVLRLAGTSLVESLPMARLDPQFRYVWPDGSELTVADDPATTCAAFEQFRRGAGTEWRRWDARGRRSWDVASRTFLAGPMTGTGSMLRRLRSPGDLLAIDPLRTLAARAEQTFHDPRLRQWAGRYATYSGSSPYRAPATLACIAHVECRFGAWYPRGGVSAVRDALAAAACAVGVEMVVGRRAIAIDVTDRRVVGVRLDDGTALAADVAVANVDAEHLYRDLAPNPRRLRRVRRAERSTSGFVLLAAVRGRTPDLAHHNVWFSADDRAEFAALDAGRPAPDPTVYGCVSAVTDPSQAPDGDENWFLLVTMPPGADLDRQRHTEFVLETLAARGTDLRHRLLYTETITPSDMEQSYGSSGGAIYGTSSNGRRAAFLRPANRGHARGLYLVGGSSHPGGGLPLVTTSARIVAGMIERDGW